MTTQLDCSIGIKKETTYGTYATVDRFLEFTDESLDLNRTFYQGTGMRPGSRLPRSARNVLTQEGAAGDITVEFPTKGAGVLLEALFGVAASNEVTTGVYQQLFTLSATDYQPAYSIQKGIPRLGGDTVDALTFLGASCASGELSLAAGEVLKLMTSWTAREVVTSEDYETPSYASGVNLFSFVGAALRVGGSVTVPTTTALASGGTAVANIRDFSVSIDQGHDSNGFNIGGAGKRSRKPAVGAGAVTGTITAEYDATTFRDALLARTSLAMVATFEVATEIVSGYKPTVQIVIPDIRFDGELPKANGGDVIAQSIPFTAFDGLVAAEPIYVAVRTADTAI